MKHLFLLLVCVSAFFVACTAGSITGDEKGSLLPSELELGLGITYPYYNIRGTVASLDDFIVEVVQKNGVETLIPRHAGVGTLLSEARSCRVTVKASNDYAIPCIDWDISKGALLESLGEPEQEIPETEKNAYRLFYRVDADTICAYRFVEERLVSVVVQSNISSDILLDALLQHYKCFEEENGAYEFADANTLEKAGTFVSMKRLVNKGVWLISYRPRSI